MIRRFNILFVCALVFACTPVLAATPAYFQSQRFGDAADQYSQAVATDANGNVYVTGYFTGSIDFGGGVLTSAGSNDVFLAKFNSAGVHQWSMRFGSADDQRGTGVATDAAGNVYIVGSFKNAVNFGAGNLFSAGLNDIFLAKFNGAGALQFAKRFGNAGDQPGGMIATDPAGNVILGGYFGGRVNFGGGNLVNGGGWDVYVVEFNSAGISQWSHSFGDAANQRGLSVDTDGFGNVYLTGEFAGEVNFTGGLTDTLVSAGANDVFLAKFNAGGVHQWSHAYGDALSQSALALAADAAGNTYVTGFFQGSLNFGSGAVVAGGVLDVFLAKVDATGTGAWARHFNTFIGSGNALATDAGGNVYVAGSFSGAANFGGGSVSSAGGSDIFLVKYGSAGSYEWGQQVGDDADQIGTSLTTDGLGAVYVSGPFTGDADFGGGALTSAGGTDVYLAKMSEYATQPILRSIADVPGDQGRRVRLTFSRSGHDTDASPTPVTGYEVYRRNDPPSATVAMPAGSASRRQILDLGWVYTGNVPAHGVNDYLVDASTDADSTIASGQHYSVFFIRAATAHPLTYFDSPLDSGYSVDNIAPPPPANVVFAGGMLSWDPSTAPDFHHFTVYGSNAGSFASAVVIDNMRLPQMNVSAAPYARFFVTSSDSSGNEGGPGGADNPTGTGGTPDRYVLSVSSFPNPFNPATTVRYAVPSRGRVTVSVFDTRGALVATLVDETSNAGAYTVSWNGHDTAGRPASSGVYFARVSHASGTRSYKMVLLK
jgi:FlgD Ig-like domain